MYDLFIGKHSIWLLVYFLLNTFTIVQHIFIDKIHSFQ